MTKPSITGLVLAGGAGRRAGGRDKGLEHWNGAPLVEHVVTRFKPQVNALLISCNRNVERYAVYVPHTVADRRPGFQGPLAGIEAAAPLVQTQYLVVVACDLPRLPPDLATRLTAPLLRDPTAAVAFARAEGRDHYLCAALRTTCLHTLTTYLDQGGRAVRDWYRQQRAVSVDFAGCEDAFINVNRPGQATSPGS